jgi:hypothetical protein
VCFRKEYLGVVGYKPARKVKPCHVSPACDDKNCFMGPVEYVRPSHQSLLVCNVFCGKAMLSLPCDNSLEGLGWL